MVNEKEKLRNYKNPSWRLRKAFTDQNKRRILCRKFARYTYILASVNDQSSFLPSNMSSSAYLIHLTTLF